MNPSIPDLGEPLLRSGLLDKISHFVGESPEATQRTFQAALPTAMYAIADHGSTEAGAGGLLDGLKSRLLPETDTQQLGQTLDDPRASERLMESSTAFLQSTLGGKLDGMIYGLSQHGGTSREGAEKILALVTPIALGVIGKRVREDNLDAQGLSGFLRQQKSQIATMVPGKIGALFEGNAHAVGRVTAPHRYVPEKPRKSFMPWVLAGIAAAIGFLLMGRANRSREPTPPAGTTETRETQPAPAAPEEPGTAPEEPGTAPDEPGGR